MEKLFINSKQYISPQCEILEIKTESNILQGSGSLKQTEIDIIEDGTISHPQQIFSRSQRTPSFDQEGE